MRRPCSTPNAAAAFAAARNSSRPARPPSLVDARRVRGALRSLAERGPTSDRVREDALAEINRVLGRSAGTRRVELRADGTFMRSFVPVGDAFAGLVIPDRRIGGRCAHPRRAESRAPLRGSALPARVFRQHEERSSPLVRHGHVRQSRQGGAAPGEAQVTLSRYVEPLSSKSFEHISSSDRRSNCGRLASTIRPFASCVVDAIDTAQYRRLYDAVGAQWHWTDRRAWSDERLAAHLARAAISVFECLVGDESAGFFELERIPTTPSRSRTSASPSRSSAADSGRRFSPVPSRRHWHSAPARVWLHTCTLDSPHALPNYQSRGFAPFNRETYVVQLPPSD